MRERGIFLFRVCACVCVLSVCVERYSLSAERSVCELPVCVRSSLGGRDALRSCVSVSVRSPPSPMLLLLLHLFSALPLLFNTSSPFLLLLLFLLNLIVVIIHLSHF